LFIGRFQIAEIQNRSTAGISTALLRRYLNHVIHDAVRVQTVSLQTASQCLLACTSRETL